MPGKKLNYEVVDGDGHIIFPSEDWWKSYLPKKYWEWMPQQVVEDDGTPQLYAEGRKLESPTPMLGYKGSGTGGMGGVGNVGTLLTPGGWKYDNPEAISLAEARKMSGADPHDRLVAMDKDGVDVAYLYPSQILSLTPALQSSAFALAVEQAYNDWLTDFCSVNTHRLRGIALVPQQDTILAVEEARRARKKGFHAIMLRPNTVGGINLDHPNYERVWDAAEDLNIAIGVHEGYGLKIPQVGVERVHNFFQGHVACHPFEHMLACLLLITGGVFYRHPKLRVGFMENGAGWAPFWLNRIDEHYEKLRRFYPEIKEEASETFKRQCFLGVEPDDHLIPHMVDFGLEDTLIFSSDFPHFDAIFPGSAAALADRDDLSPLVKRKALRDNALRMYGVKK